MLRVGKVGIIHIRALQDLRLMSSSKLDLLKISRSNIWNMVNVINILGTYICTDGVRQQYTIQSKISQMDHPHISVTQTPPFSMTCTNLPNDLFI
jgi:hypothetical protein